MIKNKEGGEERKGKGTSSGPVENLLGERVNLSGCSLASLMTVKIKINK